MRTRPLWMLAVALLATMSLAVAAGCGGDDVESVVSDITQSETGMSGGAAEDVDDPGSTSGSTAPEGGATTGDAGADDGMSATADATVEGGGETGAETSGATVVEVPADEQALAYTKTTASAPAGEVTLRMPNPSPIPHNVAVDEPEKVGGEVVTKGGVSEITVNFPAGEYEYYCSVPGHREAGMVGTLTVQ